MGFRGEWGVLERSSSGRLQNITAFLQGRVFYKEQESLLYPLLVQDIDQV